MRALFLLLSIMTLARAQDCKLETLENDHRLGSAGAFKGKELLAKLKVLVAEIGMLEKSKPDASNRAITKSCLIQKRALFEILRNTTDAQISGTADFQATVAIYYRIYNDPRSALIYIDRALQLKPSELEFLLASFDTYLEAENISIAKLRTNPESFSSQERVLQEASRRADKIATNPSADKATQINALSFEAATAHATKAYSVEMTLWRKILESDPKNEMALSSLFSYAITNGRTDDAIGLMRLLARENIAGEHEWLSFLNLLAKSEKWPEYLEWIAKAPEKIVAANPALQIFRARSLLEAGRKAEAESILANIKSSDGAITLLAAQTRALVQEIDADEMQKSNRLAEALDLYKQCLGATPHPFRVREKISLLIYNYRKGLNFKPAEATRKDLAEVISLLEESIFKREVNSTVFAIFLHSLKLTDQAGELKRACERYVALYPELKKSSDFLTYCAH